MPVKIFKVTLVLFYILSSYCFSQEQQTFELCEAITKQENSRILQGIDNWLFSKHDLISHVSISDEALRRLKELKAALDYAGIEVVFVNLPSRAMMHSDKFDLSQERFKNYDLEKALVSYKNALDVLRDVGFNTPDVYDYLSRQDTDEDYAFKRDSHWLPNAAALTAELVKEAVSESYVYDALDFGEYEAVLREVAERESDLARAANTQCNLSIPHEAHKVYELKTNDNQTDLLGNTETSLVPLWGTSYSQTSNFAEFLQAELDVDIVNYGYGAAGLWRSLRQYFLEQELESETAKLAIWEFPYAYFEEFNFLDRYQELIPTIYGSCEDAAAIVPTVIKEINQGSAVNVLSESASQIQQGNWNAVRADLYEHDIPEQTEAIKLVFNGEKNPWLSHQVETEATLSNKIYEFSVWLWTDGPQPRNAGLLLFSGKDNVSSKQIRLTPTPTLYTLSHSFSETDKTSFTIRVDGLKQQWTPNSKGKYLYVASPQVRQLEALELLRVEEDAVLTDDYYTYIEFEDMVVRNYQLVYNYADGSTQYQTIERDIYSDNNGRYFYELPSTATAPLTSIYIDNLTSTAVGTVSAQLCKKPSQEE